MKNVCVNAVQISSALNQSSTFYNSPPAILGKINDTILTVKTQRSVLSFDSFECSVLSTPLSGTTGDTLLSWSPWWHNIYLSIYLSFNQHLWIFFISFTALLSLSLHCNPEIWRHRCLAGLVPTSFLAIYFSESPNLNGSKDCTLHCL